MGELYTARLEIEDGMRNLIITIKYYFYPIVMINYISWIKCSSYTVFGLNSLLLILIV